MQFFANPEVLVALDEKRAKKLFFILGFCPFRGLPISIRSDFDRFRLDFVGFDENLMACIVAQKNHEKR